jgi:uncharacterized protein (TIGR02145 family)
LVNYLDSLTSGTKLKSKSPDWNGTDDYGFSALPGGGRNSLGTFNDLGAYGYWWTATEIDASNAYRRRMISDYTGVSEANSYKVTSYSVRCVMD